MPWSPIPCESTVNGRQLVGLIVKFGLVDVDLDRAHPDRDAADDRGHRVGDGDDLGVERVDVEGDADDDDAVVVGAGQGRGDRDEADSGAPLNGPARYILPTAWKGWLPGPAATLVVPIWLEAGQLGRRLLGAARVAARRRRSRPPGSRRSRAGRR